MVGSEKAKEALAMMALHEALRNVCVSSEWTYSVFWTIRPRPRSRGGTGCKVGEENGSLMLMWEDGFCRSSKASVNRVPGLFNGNGIDKMVKSSSFDCLEELDADDPVRKAFRKMSIQLYNYGEGLMGKVASDKCHKWVFKEPTECETGISNYWQSSFDAHPPEWTDQFNCGIQTIAVIQAGHGLLQLGSCKIIPEDLHFVLRMRHTFESLGYQSGFYLSQLFAGGRNQGSGNKASISPRPPLFNWSARPLSSFGSPRQQPLGLSNSKDGSQYLLSKNTAESMISQNHHQALGSSDIMSNQEGGPADIKWPTGLSYFSALTGRADDKHLFFSPENFPDHSTELELPRMSTGSKSLQAQAFLGRSTQPPTSSSSSSSSSSNAMNASKSNSSSEAVDLQMHNENHALHFEGSASEYLSLEAGDHSNSFNLSRKMHPVSRLDKFKRSLTMPARMPSPPQLHQDQSEQHPCTMDYTPTRHPEVGSIYSDLMGSFLE